MKLEISIPDVWSKNATVATDWPPTNGVGGSCCVDMNFHDLPSTNSISPPPLLLPLTPSPPAPSAPLALIIFAKSFESDDLHLAHFLLDDIS
jgi:hypothetical protein